MTDWDYTVRSHPIHGLITCRPAGLSGADLAGANLTDAYLADANLMGANLTDAYLVGANLARANLMGANLTDAYLVGANLARASLMGANLAGANLVGANLACANLTDAYLVGTRLDPAAEIPAVTDSEILAAGLEIRGAIVYGWRTRRSRYLGSTEYLPGRCYRAPVFSVAPTECHPGIYLDSEATVNSDEYCDYGKVRCFCLRDELHRAGGKWRTKRLWICREQEAS